jgi:hypothetical protein
VGRGLRLDVDLIDGFGCEVSSRFLLDTRYDKGWSLSAAAKRVPLVITGRRGIRVMENSSHEDARLE